MSHCGQSDKRLTPHETLEVHTLSSNWISSPTLEKAGNLFEYRGLYLPPYVPTHVHICTEMISFFFQGGPPSHLVTYGFANSKLNSKMRGGPC